MKPVIALVMGIILAYSLLAQEKYQSQAGLPFDFDWRFAEHDQPGAEQPEFDDSKWLLLNVPHDFSIEHPFDSANATGPGGGYAYSGIGWYRKHFKTAADLSGKKVW